MNKMIALAMLFTIQIASAQNLQKIASNNDLTIHIDMDSIKDLGGPYYYMDVTHRYSTPKKLKDLDYNKTVSGLIINCKSYEDYTAHARVYLDEKIIWRETNSRSFDFQPDESGQAEYFCKNVLK